jgi:hydrogenase maturation protein HypF
MLPYTPLHHLLFAGGGPSCLVMTSANRGEEPMVIDNDQAVRTLGDVADVMLVHDRAIWNRCDDSVGYMMGERLHLMRRSRGFVPLPVYVEQELRPTLALGAMLNHTFAIADGKRVFLSQHIGDVDNLETLAFLKESIAKFRKWLGVDPEMIAHDLHPDLPTTHLAMEMAEGRRMVGVQHHHAHFASAVAATGVEGEAQGWVLDGTGWGADGTIWGGELLVGTAVRVRRAAHLRPLPLPGGEASIRRPLRTAAAYLHAMVPASADMPLDLWNRTLPGELSVVRRMIDRDFNTPVTSSAGRLFDAVAALLGVRDEITYEGQAAIETEQIARSGRVNLYSNMQLDVVDKDEVLVLEPQPLFEAIVEGMLAGDDRADLAMSFHEGLAQSLAAASACIHEMGGPSTVVLCGGVFQNRILIELTVRALLEAGLDPVIPGRIPVNDAGLPLGQALVANALVSEGGK